MSSYKLSKETTQINRFKEIASQLGCDEDEAAF